MWLRRIFSRLKVSMEKIILECWNCSSIIKNFSFFCCECLKMDSASSMPFLTLVMSSFRPLLHFSYMNLYAASKFTFCLNNTFKTMFRIEVMGNGMVGNFTCLSPLDNFSIISNARIFLAGGFFFQFMQTLKARFLQ